MKVLVYDDACSMCVSKSLSIVRWAKADDASRRPLSSYEGEAAARLEAAGARNEMAVLDEATGAIASGYDGIVGWMREKRGGFLARLLEFPLVRLPGRIGYRLIAYNRRIVAPTRSAIRCACDPDPNALYNGLFGLLLLVLAASGTFIVWTLVAAHLFTFLGGGGPAAEMALFSVLPPLGVAALVAVASRRGSRLAAAFHLLWMLAAAAIPWIAVVGIDVRGFRAALRDVELASKGRFYEDPPPGPPTFVWVAAVLASVALLVFEYRRRVPHLPVGRAHSGPTP